MPPSSPRPREQLRAHLQRHARQLRRVATGFGRRDADDVVQILYARWWQRMQREPGWSPPEEHAELFVCVKRVVLDEADKDRRHKDRAARSQRQPRVGACPADESLHALERLRWILRHLPAPLAEALQASLAAGRRRDPEVAAELGLSPAAFTSRLFKARRAAEELAAYYDLLSLEQATLMAELRFSGKSRDQIAHDLSLLGEEVTQRWESALAILGERADLARERKWKVGS